jgi:hypothetical protein
MQWIYAVDLCSESMQWIYAVDLCSEFMEQREGLDDQHDNRTLLFVTYLSVISTQA